MPDFRDNTHTSSWVEWELNESYKKGNAIIAMALKDVHNAILPRKIKELGLPFHAWNPNELHRLIQNATPAATMTNDIRRSYFGL